jgi:hypothetical protein
MTNFHKCDDCDGIPSDTCPCCHRQAEASHEAGGSWVMFCGTCQVLLRDIPSDEPQTAAVSWAECPTCEGHGGFCEDEDGDIQDTRNPKFPAWS